MLAGCSSASRDHNRLAPSRSCWRKSSMANPFRSRFRSAFGELLDILAQIHQVLEGLFPFLGCQEPRSFEPEVD